MFVLILQKKVSEHVDDGECIFCSFSSSSVRSCTLRFFGGRWVWLSRTISYLTSSLLGVVPNSTALPCVCRIDKQTINWLSEWKGSHKIVHPLCTGKENVLLKSALMNSWVGPESRFAYMLAFFHNSIIFCFLQWHKFMAVLHYDGLHKTWYNHIF